MDSGGKLRCSISGRMKGKEIKVKGIIERVNIEPGFKHSFYVKTRTSEYSVGGKSARIEDIAMQSLELLGFTT